VKPVRSATLIRVAFQVEEPDATLLVVVQSCEGVFKFLQGGFM
jgi:hypothetical protein